MPRRSKKDDWIHRQTDPPAHCWRWFLFVLLVVILGGLIISMTLQWIYIDQHIPDERAKELRLVNEALTDRLVQLEQDQATRECLQQNIFWNFPYITTDAEAFHLNQLGGFQCRNDTTNEVQLCTRHRICGSSTLVQLVVYFPEATRLEDPGVVSVVGSRRGQLTQFDGVAWDVERNTAAYDVYYLDPESELGTSANWNHLLSDTPGLGTNDVRVTLASPPGVFMAVKGASDGLLVRNNTRVDSPFWGGGDVHDWIWVVLVQNSDATQNLVFLLE